MGKRKPGRVWSAPGMPYVRDSLRQFIADDVRSNERALARQAAETSASEEDERIAQAVRTLQPVYRRNIRLLDTCELYWVAPKMVELAVSSAETLPAWTPRLAMPADNGLLCWSSPAGQIGWWDDDALRERTVTWDGVRWFYTEDGHLTVSLLTRLNKAFDGRKAPESRYALVPAQDLSLDPDAVWSPDAVPGEEEDDAKYRSYAKVLGAAWLLMGQPKVAETAVLHTVTRGGGTAAPVPVPDVSIIDLRRIKSQPRESESEHPGREYHRRWWVEGHWRQQACGPGRSQRKPVWISPYVKGPEEAPLTEERVHVWRR